jgi:tetratricopeptide (TPR) repeat protein
VQLINVSTGYHLWSETFDRELKDIFAVQEEISRAVVTKLQVQLMGEQPAALVAPATENQEAYERYLKGRFFWASRTPDGLRKAVQFFEQAIAMDSAFARAYAGLADALIVLPLYTNARPADVQPRAKAAAEKALTLNPSLGEAYASLAYVRMNYDRDWKGAGPVFQKALELTPNYATANQWYGDYLAAQGFVAESIPYYDRAARLDPLSAVLNFSRAWLAMSQRRFEDAIALFQAALELDSTLVDTHTHLARTLLFQGHHAEAIDSLEKAVTRSGRRTMELAFLGYAYGVANRRADAQRMLTELNARAASGYVSPLCNAIVYLGLADLDDAFDWLERARKANDPWLTENGFDLMFDPLRADPRWIQLRKRMGLSP